MVDVVVPFILLLGAFILMGIYVDYLKQVRIIWTSSYLNYVGVMQINLYAIQIDSRENGNDSQVHAKRNKLNVYIARYLPLFQGQTKKIGSRLSGGQKW